RIRDILLDEKIDDITPIAEACLFAADRAQQVKMIIEPSIAKGWMVISDRYVDSSLVYQGVARGCGLEPVKNLNEWATDERMPDLTIFLDIPVARGLDRIASGEKDRIEKETREFHENVRNAYKTLMKLSGGRIVEVDALGTPESVHHRVVQEIEKMV
ncbi:MAG: dTMP kinase, partial [Actinobacteria bacterium]|nr:dTMP kinase [Actinomycetota bacterium]